MIKYGNGNLFKWEEYNAKPLIEFERESGIWIPNLYIEDHFEVCSMGQAYERLRVFMDNDNCDWNNDYEILYESFVKYDGNINVSSAIIRDYIEKKYCMNNELNDTEKRPLIEWEYGLGLWIDCKSKEFHYRNMTKEEAYDKISDTDFSKSWNIESDIVYSEYMKKLGSSMPAKLCDNPVLRLKSGDYSDYKERIIENVPVENFISGSVANFENTVESVYIKENVEFDTYSDNESEYVDTVLEPVINKKLEPVINFSKNTNQFDTKTDDYSVDNNIVQPIMDIDVTTEKRNIFDIFSSKKPKNKGNIKKSIIKATLAIVASITTLVSVRATSNINYKNEDIVDNSYSYIQNSEASESSNPVFVQEDQKVNNDIDRKNEKINVGHRNNNDTNDDKVKIEIGDIVTIEEDAPIYTNLDDAFKMQNGLNSSNDNEMLRKVEYIAVNYNDSIVYSNMQDEIDYYINNGGNEVAVMTSINDYDNIGIEGSYNIENIIKDSQKVKKLS